MKYKTLVEAFGEGESIKAKDIEDDRLRKQAKQMLRQEKGNSNTVVMYLPRNPSQFFLGQVSVIDKSDEKEHIKIGWKTVK